MNQSSPSFTYEQWIEQISKLENLSELAAFEEMLRSDCEMMMMPWGLGKITDLTALMRSKYNELLKAS